MSNYTLLQVGYVGAESAVFVVRVEGRGTLKESPTFRAFVSELLDNHPTAVLTLDLERCDYLDSTFLGCLLLLGKRYAQGPVRQFVIAVTPTARLRLLATTHVDRALPLTEAFPFEVGEWSTIPTAPVDAHELGWHVLECHERLADVGGPQASAFRSIVEHLTHELIQPHP